MRIEDRLIGGDLLANRSRFLGRGLIGIGRWRQGPELHQAGHQQQPSLRRREIRATNERRVIQRNKPLGVAAPDPNHGNRGSARLVTSVASGKVTTTAKRTQ